MKSGLKFRTRKMLNKFLMLVGLFIILIVSMTVNKHGEIKVKIKEVDYTKSLGYVSVRPTLNTQEDYKIPVCFSMAAFTQHGGTENWLKGVIKLIKKSPYFYVFGIYSWDLVSDDYRRLIDSNSIYNLNSYDELQLYCSLIMSTAHVPVVSKNVFKVLVVHGGMNSQWTFNYAQFHKQYDYVIGVSADSLSLIKDQSSSYIPSLLIDSNETCDKVVFCDRMLLFVGRISPEKRPDKVCELLSNLPEFCAIIIGPFYFGSNHFSCEINNVKYLGPMSNVSCYMKLSEAVLVPSTEEGGPIVAIESWREMKPVFMLNIGLAKSCPDCFVMYDWDKIDPNNFRKLINDRELINVVVRKANDVFLSDFSTMAIEKKWNVVFTTAIDSIESKGPLPNQIKWSNSDGFFVRRIGKVLRFNCFSTLCSIKMSFPKSSIILKFSGFIRDGFAGHEKIEDKSTVLIKGEFILRSSHSDFLVTDVAYK